MGLAWSSAEGPGRERLYRRDTTRSIRRTAFTFNYGAYSYCIRRRLEADRDMQLDYE